MITEADGGLHLVRLDGAPSALHLTRRGNLDALGVDDRFSTGRLDDPGVHGDPLLTTAQQLSDAVYDWWNGAPPSLVYRTRSTPSARTMAFGHTVAWDGTHARLLRDAAGLLARLVTHHGFTVPDQWLR